MSRIVFFDIAIVSSGPDLFWIFYGIVVSWKQPVCFINRRPETDVRFRPCVPHVRYKELLCRHVGDEVKDLV
jgi:hypothetical protein